MNIHIIDVYEYVFSTSDADTIIDTIPVHEMGIPRKTSTYVENPYLKYERKLLIQYSQTTKRFAKAVEEND